MAQVEELPQRDEEQDQEFLDLIGFLADPKLEVQKLAAEGVLAQTATQEFLAFCQEKPRLAGKQLLRLIERAEEDTVSKVASATAAKAGGTPDQIARAKRAALMEVELSTCAGAAALQALVNLSAVPAVCAELIELHAARRIAGALRSGWLEGRSGLAHWYAMVLANISTTTAGQKALCEDEALVGFLLLAFVAKPRPPPREGSPDPLLYLGKVLGNVCALPEGRQILAKGEQGSKAIGQYVGELRDRGRRLDVLNGLHNVCLDEECHEAVIKTPVAWIMAMFLYPWEKAPADARAELPEDLRKELESEGATMTTDAAVRGLAASCLVGLCQSESGREYMEATGCGAITSMWSMEEPDENVGALLSSVRAKLGC